MQYDRITAAAAHRHIHKETRVCWPEGQTLHCDAVFGGGDSVVQEQGASSVVISAEETLRVCQWIRLITGAAITRGVIAQVDD